MRLGFFIGNSPCVMRRAALRLLRLPAADEPGRKCVPIDSHPVDSRSVGCRSAGCRFARLLLGGRQSCLQGADLLRVQHHFLVGSCQCCLQGSHFLLHMPGLLSLDSLHVIREVSLREVWIQARVGLRPVCFIFCSAWRDHGLHSL